MKVAFIENDERHISLLRQNLKNGWDVDYFYNTKQFGFSNISDYDAIVADLSLQSVSGRELVKSISSKTRAQLFLMGSEHETFSDDDVNNQQIAGLVEKDDIEGIIDQLNYADVKQRINKIMESEHSKLQDFLMNGGAKDYTIEKKDDVIIIGIMRVIQDKPNTINMLQAMQNNKAVLFFNENVTVSSMYLSELVFFYKFFKNHKGKIAFWSSPEAKNHEIVINTLKACTLDHLIPAFDTLSEAIEFVQKNDA